MRNFWIVVLYECIQAMKTWSFWLITFGIPLLYVIIFSIMYFAGKQTQQDMEIRNNMISQIFVHDNSGIVRENGGNQKVVFVESPEIGKQKFLDTPESIFIQYPKYFVQSSKVILMTKSQTLMDGFSDIAQSLAQKNIEAYFDNDSLLAVYKYPLQIEQQHYLNGELVTNIEAKKTIGILGTVTYFLMMIFGSNRMLTSMVQEKENRMIEVVVSSIHPGVLIAGKIAGGFLLILLQLSIILLVPLLLVFWVRAYLPQNISVFLYGITVSHILWLVWYVIFGFLTFAGLMVGAGSLGSNQKEASNFSAIFLVLGIVPLYFFTMIVVSPQSWWAIFLSYFPLTSPLILLLRTGMDGLFVWEYFLAPFVVVVYMLASFWFAVWSFRKGAFQYTKSITWKDMFH